MITVATLGSLVKSPCVYSASHRPQCSSLLLRGRDPFPTWAKGYGAAQQGGGGGSCLEQGGSRAGQLGACMG
eukprot:1144943-Pelagomonas_calceolata.AAC.3